MKLKPDIVALAKGITSAYFPVSATVIYEKIWNVLKYASPEFGPVIRGFTYSGHAAGGALGLVNIDRLVICVDAQQPNRATADLQLLQIDRVSYGADNDVTVGLSTVARRLEVNELAVFNPVDAAH